MTTVSDVYAFLDRLAPYALAESWDRSGFNVGRGDHPVHKILVALDPTETVCREAADRGADLLVTHHTLLWHPDFVNDRSQQGKCALFLIEHGTAHINAHTNLDLAPEGVNQVLARRLGLTNVRLLNPCGTLEDGRLWGLVRVGEVPRQPLGAFLRRVKTALGCPALRYADGGRDIGLAAVGGGCCTDEIRTVAAAGCDAFVTADAKYNDFWDARDLGLTLIDAGHFYTENPVCALLAEKIAAAFPEVSVEISQKHADCMKFFE